MTTFEDNYASEKLRELHAARHALYEGARQLTEAITIAEDDGVAYYDGEVSTKLASAFVWTENAHDILHEWKRA